MEFLNPPINTAQWPGLNTQSDFLHNLSYTTSSGNGINTRSSHAYTAWDKEIDFVCENFEWTYSDDRSFVFLQYCTQGSHSTLDVIL